VRHRYLFGLWYTVGVFTLLIFGFYPLNEYTATIHINELLTDFHPSTVDGN
jgi:hypothetical protein